MRNKERWRVNSNKRLRKVIDALVKAAEREGGIHKLTMCGGILKWRNSVVSGFLWYNVRIPDQSKPTTRMIEIK